VVAYSHNMFEAELAQYYDVMRQYRDYAKECQFAHDLIQKYYPGAKHVLDIACGTGGHAIEMAQRGYDVTAIDKSQDMINIAREKAEKAGVTIDFDCIDVNDLSSIGEFQAAYCLGYTFLYMTNYADVVEFFTTVHEVLSPQGVFLLDFINGWSLIEEFHRDKFVYQHEGTTIFQFEQATLKKRERVKHIEFYYLIDHHDGNVKTVFAEEDVRIFFNDEVSMLLSSCGFGNIESFGDYAMDENADAAYIIIVAGQKAGGISKAKERD